MSDDETQAEIAERLAWSRDKVAKHSQLLNQIVTDVLEIARDHQTPRVTEDVTSVTFSEYWFRTSGLYDLNREGVDTYATRDGGAPKFKTAADDGEARTHRSLTKKKRAGGENHPTFPSGSLARRGDRGFATASRPPTARRGRQTTMHDSYETTRRVA